MSAKVVKWWLAITVSVFQVVWGFFLLILFGVNSLAAIIGVGFIIWGTWMFLKVLDLRHYVWHGDLR